MAVFALVDAEILQGGARLTCASNTFTLDAQSTEQDATTFCSGGWRETISTVKGWTLTPAGFWDVAADESDDLLWPQWGGTGNPTSVVPAAGTTEGSAAYLGEGVVLGLGPMGGAVGDLAGNRQQIRGVGRLARGVLGSNVEAIGATANGTGHQLGAVTAGQRFVAAVHVLAATGTWSVSVQHDDNAGFTTATTLGTTVAVTSGTAPLGGLITSTAATADDYWRAVFTRTSGTITAMVTLGII